MLIIYIHNDGTGTESSSNYDYEINVNLKQIAGGRIEGHNRSDGWITLLKMLIDREENK